MVIYRERKGHILAGVFSLRRIIYAFGGYKCEVQMLPVVRLRLDNWLTLPVRFASTPKEFI
jgi:hypothetical protein